MLTVNRMDRQPRTDAACGAVVDQRRIRQDDEAGAIRGASARCSLKNDQTAPNCQQEKTARRPDHGFERIDDALASPAATRLLCEKQISLGELKRIVLDLVRQAPSDGLHPLPGPRETAMLRERIKLWRESTWPESPTVGGFKNGRRRAIGAAPRIVDVTSLARCARLANL